MRTTDDYSKKIKLKDYRVRRLLPVIVAFDTNGSMKPIRIQVDDIVYTVQMCYCISTGGTNITYQCDVFHNGHTGMMIVTYNTYDKKWYSEI